jgi:hypothetical protein
MEKQRKEKKQDILIQMYPEVYLCQRLFTEPGSISFSLSALSALYTTSVLIGPAIISSTRRKFEHAELAPHHMPRCAQGCASAQGSRGKWFKTTQPNFGSSSIASI